MTDKKTLKERIIQSIFIYETKRMTVETILKLSILLIAGGIILIFGGVVTDIFIESEIGSLFNDYIAAKEYSYSKILELGSIVYKEIPQWLILTYGAGIVLGCILIISIIRNWKLIVHKIRSVFHYWLHV